MNEIGAGVDHPKENGRTEIIVRKFEEFKRSGRIDIGQRFRIDIMKTTLALSEKGACL